MRSARKLFFIAGLAAITLASNAQLWLTNGLVAHYPLKGNASDVLANGNTGTLQNGAYYTNGVHGEATGAVYFNGADAFVYIGKNDAVYPNRFLTWTVWFKAVTNPCTIFWDDDDQGGGDRGIFINSDRTLLAGDTTQYLYSTAVVDDGKWHHAAFTSGTNGQRLYLDGVLLTATSALLPDHAGRSSISIGAGQYLGTVNGNRLKGSISSVRIYNRALESNEVMQLHLYESLSQIHLDKAVRPSFVNLYVGTNYQLQVSGDLNTWTNHGAPFGATNSTMVYPQYWDVADWNKLFFRVQAE